MEARQAGIRSQGRERDVGIAFRAQAFDGAQQDLRRKPAPDRLDRGWRPGVRRQQTRGQQVCQLLPEQRIQGLIALQDIRRAEDNRDVTGSGCAVRSRRSIGAAVSA